SSPKASDAPTMRGRAVDGWRAQSELVGRGHELGELDAALERAVRFDAPQRVSVVGVQGVGKSRLYDEWAARLRARAPTTRLYRASAAGASAPYGLIARLLRARFGVSERDAEEQAVARFRTELQAVFADRRLTEVIHFLGGFLGLRIPDNPFLRA